MAATSSTARTSNRKRSAVSYCADDYFNSIDFALSEQDAAKDATVDNPEIEKNDSSEQDGSFHRSREGKPLKKKVKMTPKMRKEEALVAFRFMDLPAELRREILELSLVEPGSLTVVSRTKGLRRVANRGLISIDESAGYSGKAQPAYRGYWGQRTRVAGHATYIGRDRKASLNPKLCAVSKQMREEACTILYRQEIILEDMTALHIFLTCIGSFNRRLLSHLTIKGWAVRKSTKPHNFAAFCAMTDCLNLQSLFLDCSIGYISSPVQVARQIFKDAHHFLEAYGTANGGYDAGVDMLHMSDFHFLEKSAINPSPTSSSKTPESLGLKQKAAVSPSMTFNEKKYEEFDSALRLYLKR